MRLVMRIMRFTRITGFTRLLGAVAVLCAAALLSAQDWQAVIAELRDNNAGKRLAALRQLNAANYQPAAQYVAPLVTDPNDEVQVAAIDAEITFFTNEPIGTGSSGSRALEAFNAGPLVRSAAREPDVLIDQLITATADRNARVRFDAIHAIGVIVEPGRALTPLGTDAASRLVTGLQQPDPVMRAATARVLGRIRAVSAGDALIAVLNDKSELVQQFAAESLGWLKHDRAVQALTDRVAYFGKDDRAKANDALLALARIAHGSSRNLFRVNLTNADSAARRAAIEGLARVGDRASMEQIRALGKNDPSNDVRLAALFALNAFGEPQASAIALLIGRPDVGPQARDYLFEIGPAAAPAVAAAMTTASDVPTRAELAHLIGFIGSAPNTAALESMTRDADPRAARAAVDALARLRR
jgi:HEAT repeat protein